MGEVFELYSTYEMGVVIAGVFSSSLLRTNHIKFKKYDFVRHVES